MREVIKRALIPATVLKVNVNEETQTADVYILGEEKPKII
jgi:transcription antitermination factor NusA-like protein